MLVIQPTLADQFEVMQFSTAIMLAKDIRAWSIERENAIYARSKAAGDLRLAKAIMKGLDCETSKERVQKCVTAAERGIDIAEKRIDKANRVLEHLQACSEWFGAL